MRVAAEVILPETDRQELRRWVRSPTVEARLHERAKIILKAADGAANHEIAEALDVHQDTASKWRQRYLRDGLDGLRDAPRSGRPPEIGDDVEARIVEATLTPPTNRTHWSTRTMAKHIGVSDSTVRRVWKKHDLKPHVVRTFKLSNDPKFEEKITDIVGLYLDPPEGALVLSVDEKSQIQALDRSQPILPIREGLPEHQSHDYKRHGTTTLFAALNTATGEAITQLHDRHRAAEFIQFLDTIDEATPEELDLHIIIDNYATHKTPDVKAWLGDHPRFAMHYTPTGTSWVNLVERLFSKLTTERIRRGVFKSVEDLAAAIEAWFEEHNEDPKPFVWTKKAEDIIRKVRKYRRIYDALH